MAKLDGHQADPISEGGQPLSCRRQGRWILIQADQAQTGMGREQQGAVAAAAHGGIKQGSLAREVGKARYHGGGENRLVIERLLHGFLPKIRTFAFESTGP